MAGTAGHGLAMAHVLLLHETAGAFGGLSIGLNGIVTAPIMPLLARWLTGWLPCRRHQGTTCRPANQGAGVPTGTTLTLL